METLLLWVYKKKTITQHYTYRLNMEKSPALLRWQIRWMCDRGAMLSRSFLQLKKKKADM